MPLSFLDRLTPRVSLGTRLLTGACLWSGMGTWLTVKGFILGFSSWPLLVLCTGLGWLKSRFVLDRVARQIIAHGQNKKGLFCLGGLFPIQNWLLIATMIILGQVSGALSLPPMAKNALYVLVGMALARSSRLLWRAWRKSAQIKPAQSV